MWFVVFCSTGDKPIQFPNHHPSSTSLYILRWRLWCLEYLFLVLQMKVCSNYFITVLAYDDFERTEGVRWTSLRKVQWLNKYIYLMNANAQSDTHTYTQTHHKRLTLWKCYHFSTRENKFIRIQSFHTDKSIKSSFILEFIYLVLNRKKYEYWSDKKKW